MDTESHPRPRRARHDSSKLYDSERKDLQLSEVLDVLQRYVDYGGGINCCVCGKLYKSRVCFIKHLWEHTIYWDLFAGDKNHMRVLSIQAALILYGTCQQPLCPIPVDSLLVTSPHSTDSNSEAKMPATDTSSPLPAVQLSGGAKKVSCSTPRESAGVLSARDAAKLLPTTPVKQNTLLRIPSTPRKKLSPDVRARLKRKAPPPKLDLETPEKVCEPVLPRSPTQDDTSHSPVIVHSPEPLFHTPVKQTIPFAVPKTPKKRKKFAESEIHQNHQVRRCLLPTTDMPEHQYWKEADSCTCKRKRSE